MTDVFEVDERFIPIATLDVVVQYMESDDHDALIRKLVKRNKIAKKSDDDYELTIKEIDQMLNDLSLRVVADFLTQTRH